MSDYDALVAFLTARLDDDEADAQTAAARSEGALWVVTGADNAVGVSYDPAHVLRDVEAKRAIISAVAPFEVPSWHGGGYAIREQARDVLRHLAAVWADHPDYRDQWRP